MFGWSLFKVKNMYKNLYNRGDVNLVNLEKEDLREKLNDNFVIDIQKYVL